MQGKLKKTLLAIPIIFFLLLCVLFFFLYKNIKNNIEISKRVQVDLQKETLRREEVKNFNDSFKLIEKDKAELETHFAQSSNIVPFLDTIERISNSVGVVTDVSSIEVTEDNSALSVQIKSKGSFEQIYKLLLLLENSPYELEFSSVGMYNNSDMSQKEKNNKKNEWVANFKIKLISFM